MLGPEKSTAAGNTTTTGACPGPQGGFMRSLARQAGACLIESRPSVQLVCLLRFLAGSLLGVAAGPARPGNVAIVAFGWTCCTMAILFNGVTDREEDVANASTRPIASAGSRPVRRGRSGCPHGHRPAVRVLRRDRIQPAGRGVPTDRIRLFRPAVPAEEDLLHLYRSRTWARSGHLCGRLPRR